MTIFLSFYGKSLILWKNSLHSRMEFFMDTQIQQTFEQLKQTISVSTSPFHTAKEAMRRLNEAGFVTLDWDSTGNWFRAENMPSAVWHNGFRLSNWHRPFRYPGMEAFLFTYWQSGISYQIQSGRFL